MTTRTRPMATDGHSLEADLSASSDTIAKVEGVILDIVDRIGPATDDQIAVIYHHRAEKIPSVPNVTDQRIRTVRAELVRKGLIRANSTAGISRHGHRATRWQLGASF